MTSTTLMAGDNFDKGWVYILHFTIPGVKSNYFKIGLTKNPVSSRIAGLQTGNPFQIVQKHRFDSECMGLLEGHLHKIFAKRRYRKEWFTFTPSVLKKVIKEGTDFSAEYNAHAIKLRKLDKQTSIHNEMKPTKVHLKLHKEAIKLSQQIQEIELKRDIAGENLRRLTGNCIGIRGVSKFTSLSTPAPSVKGGELKKHDKAEWDKWQKTGLFKKDEGIIGIGTKAKNHAKLDSEHKALKKISTSFFDLSTYTQNAKSRSTQSRTYHSEYIDCVEKLGTLKAELDMIIIQFKLACKRRKGIEGVYKYIRRDNHSEFDKKSFAENSRKAKNNKWFYSSDPSPSFGVEKAIGYL
jgi:hypothetical protein